MSDLTYKGIHKLISKRVRVKADGRKKTKAIPYSLYFKIITKFFEIVTRDLILRRQKIWLPLGLGSLNVEEREHNRAFHIRLDRTESKAQGKPIRYKVPIIDDTYYKVIWTKRRGDIMRCKFLPSQKVRNLIKENYAS